MATSEINQPYPWQQQLWQRLGQQLAKLPHALLFSGPAGLGKAKFARAFVASLLCAQPTAKGFACGHCQSCGWFRANSHPDFLLVAPVEDGKAIKVEQIRQLLTFSRQSRHCAARKLILLLAAETMNLAAANSLLKVLEEPPAGVHLLLVSSAENSLLATIRSRCQRLVFNIPDVITACAWLAEQDIGEQDPKLLLNIAQGAPLNAVKISSEQNWLLREQCFKEWLAVGDNHRDPVATAISWSSLPTAQLLSWLYSWLSDALRLQYLDNQQLICNLDFATELVYLAHKYEPSRLHAAYDELITLCRDMFKSNNLNPKLLWQAFLCQWSVPTDKQVLAGNLLD